MKDGKIKKAGEADKPPYEPTPIEAKALASYKVAKERSGLRLKVALEGNAAKIGPDHPDHAIGTLALMRAIGTADFDFHDGLMLQLVNAAEGECSDTEKAVNFMLSVVKGVEPRDQTEALLAAQMAAVHNATMTFARRLAHVENIPQQDSAPNAFNKLARTFAAQVEALKRYRSGGEQKMTVQHVHVAEGGQAIVGNVNAPPRGWGRAKNRGSTPCSWICTRPECRCLHRTGGAPGAVDHVVAVDVDTTDERVIDAIRHIPPPNAVERIGSKGYAALYRASPSLASATFDVDGQRAVDFLALGRQLLVPPTVHPKTEKPYVYTSILTLEDVTPSDLPRLPNDFVERMREALAPFGEVRHNVDRRFGGDDDYCGPWSEVNRAALDNFDAWLPSSGLNAERERDGSYRGPAVWRGGDNPTSVSYDHRGIRDFARNEGLTPIDVVRRAGAAECDWDADDWLREKLGMPVLQRVRFTFRKAGRTQDAGR